MAEEGVTEREEKSDEELNCGFNAGCVFIWRDSTTNREWGWRASYRRRWRASPGPRVFKENDRKNYWSGCGSCNYCGCRLFVHNYTSLIIFRNRKQRPNDIGGLREDFSEQPCNVAMGSHNLHLPRICCFSSRRGFRWIGVIHWGRCGNIACFD